MTIRRLSYASVVGWALGLAIIAVVVAGVGPTDFLGLGSDGATAAEKHFSDDEAIAAAAAWARPYIAETIGKDRGSGEPLSLDGMTLVDVRFLSDARDIVTSATTAVSLPGTQDVWVLSWERGGFANVTTGRDDGTAHLVLVLEDGTGRVLDAVVGVRQPGDQARMSGAWPSFNDLLGDAVNRFREQGINCTADAHAQPGSIVAFSCK